MLSRWVGFAAAFLLWWLPGAAPASAHDLPLDRFMNGFVRIEPHQADLVIRVPLDLLRAVSFSVVRGHYDLAASQPAIKTALDALSSDLSLSENGRRLAPVRAAGTLAPLADRSFEDYGQAAAGIAAPPAPDETISFEGGYLDAHFTYAIASPKSVFAIESFVAADLGDTVKLAVRYIPLDGSRRALLIAGGAGRVPLDPTWY
ncbi:MAG: hypothetical protein WA184_14265, partial [Stellaceae bacterium]